VIDCRGRICKTATWHALYMRWCRGKPRTQTANLLNMLLENRAASLPVIKFYSFRPLKMISETKSETTGARRTGFSETRLFGITNNSPMFLTRHHNGLPLDPLTMPSRSKINLHFERANEGSPLKRSTYGRLSYKACAIVPASTNPTPR
jgi:hypothetical protein